MRALQAGRPGIRSCAATFDPWQANELLKPHHAHPHKQILLQRLSWGRCES